MGKGARLREERKAKEEVPERPDPLRVEKPSIAKDRRHRTTKLFREYRQLPPEVKAALIKSASTEPTPHPNEEKTA